MLLTKPQRRVLELAEKLGAVRYRQLVSLLEPCGQSRPGQLDAMLRQLCYAGIVTWDREIICASGADPPGEEHFEAIDVMLEITNGNVLDCAAGRGPVLLRFLSGGDQARPFFVASHRNPARDLPLPLLPGQRAVVMLAENNAALRAALPSSHFAAVPDANGRHRFFRCGGK